MKLSHYYKKLIFIIISTFCVFDVMAKQDIDDRVKKLTLELRCMTCQNQSIYDSEAEFSNDIKGVVHADNSSRVQICEENQLLGKILMNLKKHDIYLIANTSFNISSDPMVYDKEDAFLATERMNIKYLLTETGLFVKK